MSRLAAIDQLWQQQPTRADVEPIENVRNIASRAKVAEGEDALRDIGRAHAGQPKIKPVLAVLRRGRTIQHVRRMALQPDQLAALIAGGEPAAGMAVHPPPHAIDLELIDDPSGTRIEPQPGGRYWLSGCIDQPGTISLPCNRKGGNAIGQLARRLGKRAQDSDRIPPGLYHVLLDRAVWTGLVKVRPCRGAKLPSFQIEDERLDDRRPG